jgi:putative restriction endonuclease
VTVTPDYHFEVSQRVHEEFDNGEEYYALHGQTVRLPEKLILKPAGANLAWHNENVYKG